MHDKNIDDLINAVIDREGAYVNHPADRGGPTRWGITEALARQQGYVGDMRALPRSDAAAIYRRLYWFVPGFDKIAKLMPRLAAEMFDTGINMGTGTVTGFLQRVLNALNRGASDYPDLTIDKAVGPATMAALSAYAKTRGTGAETVLLRAIDALQGARYVHLAEVNPSQEAFLYGWLKNRIG